ncbi:hypothetical protein OL548_09465 [Lysinibacillus sp. MHQ-1]|nr:hypothetical protein OL548_09465 [Lysinibacillus sp. MHQ-1]
MKAATDAYTALADKDQVINYPDLTKAQNYINMAKAFDERVLALANENPDTFVQKVAELTTAYKALDKKCAEACGAGKNFK